MSRSPRKLLIRVTDALREMEEVLARYPAAEASLRAALGDAGLTAVRHAHDVLNRAVDRLNLASASEQGVAHDRSDVRSDVRSTDGSATGATDGSTHGATHRAQDPPSC